MWPEVRSQPRAFLLCDYDNTGDDAQARTQRDTESEVVEEKPGEDADESAECDPDPEIGPDPETWGATGSVVVRHRVSPGTREALRS